MDNEPILEINENGTKRWRINNKYHRVDGPAVEWVDGDKWWYLNGKRHRVDGPACEYAYGFKSWYLDGENYNFDNWLEANNFISEEEKVMLKLIYG
jgi:hypothetical protein